MYYYTTTSPPGIVRVIDPSLNLAEPCGPV